jgi:hypothetical protein
VGNTEELLPNSQLCCYCSNQSNTPCYGGMPLLVRLFLHAQSLEWGTQRSCCLTASCVATPWRYGPPPTPSWSTPCAGRPSCDPLYAGSTPGQQFSFNPFMCNFQKATAVNKVRDDLVSFLCHFPPPCPLPSSLIQSTVLEFFPIFTLNVSPVNYDLVTSTLIFIIVTYNLGWCGGGMAA